MNEIGFIGILTALTLHDNLCYNVAFKTRLQKITAAIVNAMETRCAESGTFVSKTLDGHFLRPLGGLGYREDF